MPNYPTLPIEIIDYWINEQRTKAYCLFIQKFKEQTNKKSNLILQESDYVGK